MEKQSGAGSGDWEVTVVESDGLRRAGWHQPPDLPDDAKCPEADAIRLAN